MDVLLITKGTGGDIYPFIHLGKALRVRGHRVTLLTHSCFEEVVSEYDLRFAALGDGKESEQHVFHNSVVTNTRNLLDITRRNIEADLIREVTSIEQSASTGSVLIAHENVYLTARTAADKLNLPAGVVFLSPNSVVNLPFVAAQYELLSSDINRARAQLKLSAVGDWSKWLKRTDLALGFWPQWFAPSDLATPLAVTPVGFVLNPEAGPLPNSFREFLAEGEPPTLITHGTSIPRSPEFLKAAVEACRLLNRRAVLVTPFASESPLPLPPGVKWFKRLPFDSIMSRMDALVHHGGIGTAAQALAAGIPQVILAFGFDRPHNAARLQALGVGAHLAPVDWRAERVAQALEQLSTSSVRGRCKYFSEQLQGANSIDTACELIERLELSIPRAEASDHTGKTSAPTREEPGADVQQLVANLSLQKRALLAARLRKRVGSQFTKQKITRRVEAGPAPLSFAQQRMWVLDRLAPRTPAYNLISSVRLTGRCNAVALEHALAEIVRRHEILRTVFRESSGQAVQVVSPSAASNISFVDLTGLPQAGRESVMKRVIARAAQYGFDLTRGPLLNVLLVRLADEDHVLSLTMHHIVGDGWSTEVLTRELTEIYQSYAEGEISPLPELSIQYADFAVWQRSYLSGQMLEDQISYWRKQLSGLQPLFKRRAGGRNFAGASPWFLVSKAVTDELKSLSQRFEVTLFTTLLAAFKTVIHLSTGSTDIVIGTPNANRGRTELAPLIGFFANALVLRSDFSGNPTFVDVLDRVKQVTQDAYAHQEVPFEKLVEVLQPERNLDHSPLFQLAFTLHSSANAPVQTGTLKISPVFYELETAPYDLVLIVDDAKRGLGGVFNYSTDFFDAATIAQMSQDYELVLQIVAGRPTVELSELKDLLVKARKERSKKRSEEFESASLQRLRSLKRQPLPAASSVLAAQPSALT